MTTKTAPVLDTSNDHFRECNGDNRRDMVRQIGANLMGISGGRVTPTRYGISLPVAVGYSVTVELDGNDTYVVRRVRTVKQEGVPVTRLYGERTNVYCDELSEVAYYASCYVSYDAGEWPAKS